MPGLGCGGSVLNKNTVITAAHCCQNKKLAQMITNFGDWDRGTSSDGRNVFLRPNRFVIHPGWNPNTFENDVCLLFFNNIPFKYVFKFSENFYNFSSATESLQFAFPHLGRKSWSPVRFVDVAGWGIKLGPNGQKFIPRRPDEIAVMKIDTDVCNMGW